MIAFSEPTIFLIIMFCGNVRQHSFSRELYFDSYGTRTDEKNEL